MRDAVKWFAGKMENKLRDNDHKSGWEKLRTSYLRERLTDEVEELDSSLVDNDVEDAIDECVDIANFAMMIADNMRRRHGIDDKKQEEG